MTAANEPLTAETQVAKIFEWRRGFNTIHLIDVGVRLDLFRALKDSAPIGAESLAEQLGLKPRYVATWCLTAYGQGLLDAEPDGRYRLAPFIDSILGDPKHPRYLGGYVRLGTGVAAVDFDRSPEAFATGAVFPFQGRGEEFARAIAASTQGLQVAAARKILPALPDLDGRLKAGGTVLEIGCGTGALLQQLAKSYSEARLVGVDIDADSIEAARRDISAGPYAARIDLRLGQVQDVVAPGSVDCAVMIEVLHEIAQPLRPAVVAQVARALSPGGWFVIVDETYPETLDEARLPEFRFPLQTGFEELLWGNVIPTRSEQERLLRDAGFAGDIQRSIIGEGFTVLATRR